MVSDTIEFKHQKLTITSVTPEVEVLHGVQHTMAVLKDTPLFTLDAKLQAIKDLHDTLENWAGDISAPTATTDLPRQTLSIQNKQAPRVPTELPVRPPNSRVQRLLQKAPPRVKPISNEDIPSNFPTTALIISAQAIGTQQQINRRLIVFDTAPASKL